MLDEEEESAYWEAEAEAAKAHNLRQAKSIYSMDNMIVALNEEITSLKLEADGYLDVIEATSRQLEVAERVRGELAALRAGETVRGDLGEWQRLGHVGEEMAECFSVSELDMFARLQLGINPGDISGNRLTERCMNLIGLCRRLGRLNELKEGLEKERGHISWSRWL